MPKKKTDLSQMMSDVASQLDLVEWFEQHCVWARHVSADDEDQLTTSKEGKWEVLVVTGPHTSMTFGAKTFLGAIETAKGICEHD